MKKRCQNIFGQKLHMQQFTSMNKTPTAAIHGMTPEQKFTGKKPDLSHLKVFGCLAYVHIPDELRSKLDPKAE